METQEFLLASDIHIDNPKCDRALFFKHLREAQAKNAGVFFFGDVMCLMQGKNDRRGSKASVRPEHQGSNYFDLVIEDTAKLLAPFAPNILLASNGNHETKIIEIHEIDPLKRVVEILRDKYGAKTQHFQYQGWIRFVFHRKEQAVRTCNLFFHHGAWGGVVTKGVMGGGRYGLIAPDANILINGHNHERTIVEHPCYRLQSNGQVRVERRIHIQTGTYKQEFESGAGWAVERIVMPKPLGGVWLKLSPSENGVISTCESAI